MGAAGAGQRRRGDGPAHPRHGLRPVASLHLPAQVTEMPPFISVRADARGAVCSIDVRPFAFRVATLTCVKSRGCFDLKNETNANPSCQLSVIPYRVDSTGNRMNG